jgi:hypothetical protein
MERLEKLMHEVILADLHIRRMHSKDGVICLDQNLSKKEAESFSLIISRYEDSELHLLKKKTDLQSCQAEIEKFYEELDQFENKYISSTKAKDLTSLTENAVGFEIEKEMEKKKGTATYS